MIKASELRIGNYIKVKISNDSRFYMISNIGGYRRIFETPKDEKYYNDIDLSIKHNYNPQWHDEMMVGLFGGVRTGDRIIESKIKPIPLTEEMLLKLGFPNGERSVKGGLMTFANNTLYLSDERDSNYSFVVPCKYLHELQNAFYVCEGEELDITPLLT